MIGQVLGNYRVLRVLGKGGMGTVYLAEHVLIGTKVAIKVLSPDFSANRTIVTRFFNEARAAALINHRGIVQVIDFGRVEGSAYLVMEYLEGESLGARLKREGTLPSEMILAITRQLASALGAAHAAGIVHRDLKPDNVFLVNDPDVAGGARVKVLDFGIAKLAGEGPDSSNTRTGSVMGTPHYMSPEQCRGAGRVDARADIYSLGCILYVMACGVRPFEGEGPGDVIAAHLREPPIPPRVRAQWVSPAVDAVIMRALAKLPEQRQQSMEQLLAELEATGRWTGGVGISAPSIVSLPAAGAYPGTTTLAAATGQALAVPPPRRGGRKLAIAIGAMAAGTAIAVAVIVGAPGEKSRKDEPGAVEKAAAAPAEPARDPAAPAEAGPAAPAPALPTEPVATAEAAGATPDAGVSVVAAEPAPQTKADRPRSKSSRPKRPPKDLKSGTIDPFAD